MAALERQGQAECALGAVLHQLVELLELLLRRDHLFGSSCVKGEMVDQRKKHFHTGWHLFRGPDLDALEIDEELMLGAEEGLVDSAGLRRAGFSQELYRDQQR